MFYLFTLAFMFVFSVVPVFAMAVLLHALCVHERVLEKDHI